MLFVCLFIYLNLKFHYLFSVQGVLWPPYTKEIGVTAELQKETK